jgi:hypothetical protein
MRPEAKLDSYLKLITRLEGKINLIRNTIGTDTPVLAEPENPIEYTDSVTDIYSADMQKRMQALEDAEKASDFLLSEDEFVLDLKRFNENDLYPTEYKESIYNISDGKWALTPNILSRGQSRPEVFALTKLLSEDGELTGFQFTKTDRSASQLFAVSQLQALEWLRATPEDNKRSLDKISIDKVAVKNQMESKVIQYFGDDETGSLIGQENDVLRILFTNGYVEEEIDMVRDAFKTKDVFYKRDINQLKRKVMTQKNKGDAYQETLQKLVALAKDLNKYKQTATNELPTSSKSILFYVNNNE